MCLYACAGFAFPGDLAELHDHPRGHAGPAAGHRGGPREARPGGREAGTHPAGGREQKVRLITFNPIGTAHRSLNNTGPSSDKTINIPLDS